MAVVECDECKGKTLLEALGVWGEYVLMCAENNDYWHCADPYLPDRAYRRSFTSQDLRPL